jgi:hypothetical protein
VKLCGGGCVSVRDGTVPGDIYSNDLQSTISIKNFSSHSFTYNPVSGAPSASSEPVFDGRFTLSTGVFYTPTVNPYNVNWLGKKVLVIMAFGNALGPVGANSFTLTVYWGGSNHWTYIKKNGPDFLGIYCLVKGPDFENGGATSNFLLTDEPMEIITP